ncbi:zinc-ribbon domain-containing protein [Desulfovibrio inopinatus]|uniref:zinc-ribbon domain-containing protein n=1 Tax=Desulfovibrio inopinatus TaxID=102109 RepID=UPI0003FB6CA3|nr:zinc ribbon domain-containing protein [Desulfovibrio inopinatus]
MSSSNRFCSHCGAPIEAGVKFCEQCGVPVSEAGAPQAADSPSQPPRQPSSHDSGRGHEPPPAAKKSGFKKVFRWILGIMLVLLLCIGGLLGYVWMQWGEKYGFTMEDVQDQNQLVFELENCMERDRPEVPIPCFMRLALTKDRRACKYVLPDQRETCRDFMDATRNTLQDAISGVEYTQIMHAAFRLESLRLVKKSGTPSDSPSYTLEGVMDVMVPGGDRVSVVEDESFTLKRKDGFWYIDFPSIREHDYYRGTRRNAVPSLKDKQSPGTQHNMNVDQIDPNEKAGSTSTPSWQFVGKVGTDGTGDRKTKKKGGTYLRISTKKLASYSELKIVPKNGPIHYVTIHGRYEGGIWRTVYKGTNKPFDVKGIVRSAQGSGNTLTEIIVSINGGHEKYDPVKSSASVFLR